MFFPHLLFGRHVAGLLICQLGGIFSAGNIIVATVSPHLIFDRPADVPLAIDIVMDCIAKPLGGL
jgi:hypothetical protein